MMRTKDDAVRCLNDWLENEFGQGLDGSEDLSRVGFAYCEMKEGLNEGDRYTFEQWYADFEDLNIILELQEEGYLRTLYYYEFMDYDEMIDFINGHTYDELVGIADNFAENMVKM